MRRKLKLTALIGCLAVMIIICRKAGEQVRTYIMNDRETAAGVSGSERLIVLDAGHGGVDAGKTGVNHAKEKDINLKIALKIKTLLEQADIPVVMTRDGDDRLGGTQKEDLRERVRIMNEERPVLAVSIHQNSYQGAEVRGPQLFYYTDSDEGRGAAEILQEELNRIDPEHARDAKGNDSYYILKNAEVPVVIVECGFLSNPQEAENLVSDEYQDAVAAAVAEGIKKYID